MSRPNSVEQSALPEVFQMDQPQREEFLSQVGSFTQDQRRIFHRICDFYDPQLEYNRFVLHAGKDILFANNQIEGLMKKIRAARYGLLKFRNDQGELKPDRIVITGRDSKAFYLHLIEDEIQRLSLEDPRDFLSLEEMETAGFRIPFDFVETLYPEALSPEFIRTSQGDRIFTMPLKTGGALLLTSRSLETVLGISRKKIGNALNNSAFMAGVSRLMDWKISEIQKRQFARDKAFWKRLVICLCENKEDLLMRVKHLGQGIFQSAEILRTYFANTEKEEEEKRKEEQEKQNAIEELCLEILKKENFLVTPEELLDMLKPYEKRWSGFKDLFYETVVKVNQKIGLPVILFLADRYLHRDHVYPLFRAELAIQSKELKFHYVELMERMLRTKNKDKITVFYSRDSFNEDINERIREKSPILAMFLTKPKILSEGIVHYFKNLKKVRDIGKIKDFMNNFFEDGMIRFKDSDYLLNLYLLDIFQESYKYLSWWKRMVLKVSGRYESFTGQFSGIAEEAAVPVPSRKAAASGGSRSYGPPAASRRGERSSSSYGKKSGGASSRRRSPKPEPTARYNLKQRNKAWDEFQDAFNKKK